ncbi:autoinducer 2 sensor kinase/phosphatase-like protein luxQ, partial [Sporormia fimetaria CBS 119925]
SHPSPSHRPPLQHLPASTFPDPSPAPSNPRLAEDVTESEASDSTKDETESELESAAEESGGEGAGSPPLAKASPDELEIERLRSLQLKMLQQQQRARVKSATGASLLGQRRVSPIKEETPNMSPTLEVAFSSPLGTAQTASTESTESARTIRGSVPPTPAHNLRTPSYPFPTVPNTPRTWSSSFHQPFTTLSPTAMASAQHHRDFSTPREHVNSEGSTPAATTTPFAPPGFRASPVPNDPRFPTPNLYELVLLLNSEPGLSAWWETVIEIMQQWYGAERATLAVPADASDIENVPWGQKTTFNAMAPDPPRISLQREPTPEQAEYVPRSREGSAPHEPIPPSPLRDLRPKLPSRHSFAGHERHPAEEHSSPAFPARPVGPRRTASHAPHAREHPLRQVSPMDFDGPARPNINTPARETTFSDPEFSSVGGDPPLVAPTAVFPILRALDHERDALIDNVGINRVLERGHLVTLTRDYSTSAVTESNRPSTSDKKEDEKIGYPAAATAQRGPLESGHRKRASLGRTSFGEQQARRPPYEDYEQFPSSPWAQSPAPSPAIQSETNDNPFFETTNVDEDTFNPTGSTEDYSAIDFVEAIGIDKASTITHIPFIHPTLSQPMNPTEPITPSQAASTPGDVPESLMSAAHGAKGFQRRAPIAILSILSPIVPYPRNLTNSLKLLGPHLATSFSNAWQYTNAHTQGAGPLSRRFASATPASVAHYSEPDALENLLHLDLEHVSSSAAGSMTSPSDYSGRSKYSPGGSIGGTPGWDPSSMGFTSKQSVGNTPAHLTGAEAVESYFDAKKRTHRASHGTSASQDKPAKTADSRPPKRPAAPKEEDVVTPRNEKGSHRPSAHDDPGTQAASRQNRTNTPRPHSLLHSYGADFTASFQSLPAATTPGKPGGHGRSHQEAPDMPPPSESLLRTIIDSLPVQIFTALPSTGAMTWVNSKFLVYRGQDSRQVLQDPWESIHPDDKEQYLDQWHQSLRTGQQLQRKVRLQRFDGHYRWFYVRVAPLKNKRQQIVHWIGTNMDVHDQHIAELNLARQQETAASEAKYRALANSSPQIVFVVSNMRGLSFCNSQWLTYSGQCEAQAHGTGFLEFVHPDDVPKCKLPELSDDGSAPTNVPTSLPPEGGLSSSGSSEDSSSDTERAVTSPGSSSPDKMEMPQARLSKLASTGILRVTKDASGRASYSTEVRLRNKEGEYRWHLVRILLEKALANESDEETWYGTATDINDHKLLEQTLKETMDAKSRFLSNMSHEIRTPLNGISGMVNFLLDSPLITEQLEHVNIIKASTDSLLNLINDILDLSKVEAGMIKLDMGWLHIPSLLEEVNDLNMGLAIQKGLELNYVVDEGVPSMVKGDKFRIRQVLLNVVGNAIKFTQKGEVFVRCRPVERQSGSNDNHVMVRFEVIDTGKGFNEEEAKYLFKRFSQIDASSTRQHGGTGLGLAISMQFVELHGGKMDARSVPGKGSTFFFTIKFGLPTGDDHPPTPSPLPSTPAYEPVNLPSPSPSITTSSKSSHVATPASLQTQAAANALAERMTGAPGRSDSPKSPVPSLTLSDRSKDSPSVSSAGSDPSITASSLTGKSSLRSERSSASSFLQEVATKNDPMKLSLPHRLSESERPHSDDSFTSVESDQTVRPKEPFQRTKSPLSSQPPMYSILVVCPLVHSQEATIRHIKNTLPQGIPHQVTGQSSLLEAQRMVGGDNPVIFTHIVLVLHDIDEVIAVMEQVLSTPVYENTSLVIVSDPARKRELMKAAPMYDYDQLYEDRRVQFVYRPLKPSKFAAIFDPQKEREFSTDRNQDTAQQVVVSQKLVFEDLRRRLGGKGHRVLLVEDDKINQTVILKFLAKINMDTETALDGVQCTDTVFSHPPGHYSIILCDLHMPNKDGYTACKEIRRWEKKNGYRRHPIIALSANVLGDVYAKCVDAGFNSYVTKPVEFKELSMVLAKFLDPADPTKAPELMSK